MSNRSFYCILTMGIGLTDEFRDLLMKTAHEMLADGKKKQKIKGKTFEGVVTTDRKSILIGPLAGVSFVANVETNDGTLKVTYLIRSTEIPTSSVTSKSQARPYDKVYLN